MVHWMKMHMKCLFRQSLIHFRWQQNSKIQFIFLIRLVLRFHLCNGFCTGSFNISHHSCIFKSHQNLLQTLIQLILREFFSLMQHHTALESSFDTFWKNNTLAPIDNVQWYINWHLFPVNVPWYIKAAFPDLAYLRADIHVISSL